MATYFGEVVEAESRAFWDSDGDFQDDFDACLDGAELKVSFVDKGEISFDSTLFIFVHGALPRGFAETCLLGGAVLVAEVNDQSEDASLQTKRRDYEDDLTARRKAKRPTKLYALKESVIICVCSPDLEVVQASSFIECISRWLVKSNNVIALTCELKTSHLTDEEDHSSAFLRQLSSNHYKGSKVSKRLEQPNMVKGVPAALLTYCQIFDLPAIVYVVYTDSLIADSISALPLVQLFSTLEINLLEKVAPSFKKRLYYGAEIESNLYM